VRLLLVLAPGAHVEPGALLPTGRLATPHVARSGQAREAGYLGLLGQDPQVQAWTGPAAFYAAAAGLDLVREEETAYLLDLVRVDDGRIAEAGLPWGPVRQGEILGRLAEALDDEPLQVCGGRPPVLVVGEPCVGPPVGAAAPLVGLALDDLDAGPPALLRRVIEEGRAACAAAGRPGHTVFPHAPAGPGDVTPLREAWLGLGPSAVVGSRPEAEALAKLLSLTHVPARAGEELAQARREADVQDLVVAVCDGVPTELGEWGDAVVVVAADSQCDGLCELAWRGGAEALGEGEHLLWALLGGTTQ
jgi:hypothetical protein